MFLSFSYGFPIFSPFSYGKSTTVLYFGRHRSSLELRVIWGSACCVSKSQSEIRKASRSCAERLEKQSLSGWWFGTWLLSSHILGISSSQLIFIFFRGVETTNQKMVGLWWFDGGFVVFFFMVFYGIHPLVSSNMAGKNLYMCNIEKSPINGPFSSIFHCHVWLLEGNTFVWSHLDATGLFSGKLTQQLNISIEIVDLPIKSRMMFQFAIFFTNHRRVDPFLYI